MAFKNEKSQILVLNWRLPTVVWCCQSHLHSQIHPSLRYDSDPLSLVQYTYYMKTFEQWLGSNFSSIEVFEKNTFEFKDISACGSRVVYSFVHFILQLSKANNHKGKKYQNY